MKSPVKQLRSTADALHDLADKFELEAQQPSAPKDNTRSKAKPRPKVSKIQPWYWLENEQKLHGFGLSNHKNDVVLHLTPDEAHQLIAELASLLDAPQQLAGDTGPRVVDCKPRTAYTTRTPLTDAAGNHEDPLETIPAEGE